MSTLMPLADIAKLAFRMSCQPILFMGKRAARYRAAGLRSVNELPVCHITSHAVGPACGPMCAITTRWSLEHVASYRAAGGTWQFKPWLGTACAIPLADFGNYAGYSSAVGARTGDAIHRSCKKARRRGYTTEFFHPPYLRGSMIEILGSKRFRSGGLVPYGLLGRPSSERDHGHVAGYRPLEPCPLHWTLHWGVFDTGGAANGSAAQANWRLVGFIKLRRLGSLVHALQIMGHGDHMPAGINDLMHMELMRWLYENPHGHSGGVTHYMYGALEHAGNGLLAWKLRRGFLPMLVTLDGL